MGALSFGAYGPGLEPPPPEARDGPQPLMSRSSRASTSSSYQETGASRPHAVQRTRAAAHRPTSLAGPPQAMQGISPSFWW